MGEEIGESILFLWPTASLTGTGWVSFFPKPNNWAIQKRSYPNWAGVKQEEYPKNIHIETYARKWCG